jgi:hypothetical protein
MTIKNAWSLRNVYLYVVCLITLVMVIFSTVNLVRAGVELAYPDPGYYYAKPTVISPPGKDGVDPAEIEMQQAYGRLQAVRYAVINLVGSAAMLLLAGPLYLYHWRKIERETVAPNVS